MAFRGMTNGTMTLPEGVDDDPAWQAVGRGPQLFFYSTDEELLNWIAALPEQFGPYELVSRFFDQSRTWQSIAISIPSSSEQLRAAGVWRIRAVGVTPAFALEPNDTLQDRAALRGMPLLDLGGRDRLGQVGHTTLAMSTRARNTRTGKFLLHEEYREIFAALRKAIESNLTWSTTTAGDRGEDYAGPRMTDGARAAHLGGHNFSSRPDLRAR
jgi:hypothetical protein